MVLVVVHLVKPLHVLHDDVRDGAAVVGGVVHAVVGHVACSSSSKEVAADQTSCIGCTNETETKQHMEKKLRQAARKPNSSDCV